MASFWSTIRRIRRSVVVLVALTGLATAGCASGGSATEEEACASNAQFQNAFNLMKDSAGSGDQNEVFAAQATLKDQYVETSKTLQEVVPDQAEALATAMGNLDDAIANLPQNPTQQQVEQRIQPRVDDVQSVIDDVNEKLDCPTKPSSPAT